MTFIELRQGCVYLCLALQNLRPSNHFYDLAA